VLDICGEMLLRLLVKTPGSQRRAEFGGKYHLNVWARVNSPSPHVKVMLPRSIKRNNGRERP